jgi:hypothetical protein
MCGIAADLPVNVAPRRRRELDHLQAAHLDRFFVACLGCGSCLLEYQERHVAAAIKS